MADADDDQEEEIENSIFEASKGKRSRLAPIETSPLGLAMISTNKFLKLLTDQNLKVLLRKEGESHS
jgi:hypothetical protein